MASSVFDHPALNTHPMPIRAPLSSGLMAVAMTISKWELRSRTRAALRDVPPELLPDLGLTTAEVLHETAKPFWRP